MAAYPFDEEDRTFLHDLVSPILVTRSMVKKCLVELSEHPSSNSLIKQMQRLEKAVEEIEKIEKMHAEHKDRISTRMMD